MKRSKSSNYSPTIMSLGPNIRIEIDMARTLLECGSQDCVRYAKLVTDMVPRLATKAEIGDCGEFCHEIQFMRCPSTNKNLQILYFRDGKTSKIETTTSPQPQIPISPSSS
jgi:hypothetical protein